MERTSLVYFSRVATELHFGRAAAALHISQPALSQHINRLERELGVQLLHRTTREVRLTRIGGRVAAQASILNAAEARVTKAIKELTQGRAGDLRVGFFPSAAFGVLPRVIAPFSSTHGRVRIALNELPSEEQIQQVADGELDLGLVRDIEENEVVSTFELTSESLVLACPSVRWGASDKSVDLASLRDEQFIVLPSRAAPAMYLNIERLCRSEGISLDGAREALAFPTTLGLVAGGIGVAIVPASMRSVHLPGVTYRTLSNPDAYSRVSLIKQNDSEDILAQDFVDVAVNVFKP